MKNKNKLIIIGSMLLILSVSFVVLSNYYGRFHLNPSLTALALFNKETPDHLIDKFTTIVDEEGNTVSLVARLASVGDEIYTAEGMYYRIERVQGERAEAKFMGIDKQIVAYNDFFAGLSVTVTKELTEKGKGNFAIYHSHTDESYVPTDGTESIPFKGGIFQVGKSMVEQLQGEGYQVKYDQTPHDPHDNNAYVRSRRTAVNLMKSNPTAIFDVHRDGIPDPNYYRSTINNKKIAKLRLVVGRGNPRMSANMDFAKQMMASANNLHPNVVKEIFVGKGDYNQDLSPTALLLEAGTHTNTKAEAEMGVSLFTEAVPIVTGLAKSAQSAVPDTSATPVTDRTAGASGGGAWKALAWILGMTVVGGGAFLLISAGSIENAKNKLAGFFSKELNVLQSFRKSARKTDQHEFQVIDKDKNKKE